MTLPSEYQEVEYIENSGTQYIITGITTTNNIQTETKIEETTTDQDTTIFGTYNTGSGIVSSRYYSLTPYQNKWWRGLNGSEANGGTYTPQIGKQYEIVYNDSNNNLVVDGTTVASVSGTTGPSGNKFVIGCRYGGNTRYGKFRYFYLKLYDKSQSKYVGDFVPCYRKSDNVIGLYDLVNNQFYTNSGSGTFTKGPNVVPVPTYKLHGAIQTFHYQFEVPYSWEPDASRTLIYYPLTSNLVDQMGNGNTGTAHGNVTFNATDGATSGCYVNGPSSIYVTGMSLGINSKTTCTMNVWVNFVNKTDHGNIIGYNSNYNYSQPFKIFCATNTDVRFQVSYGTSSSNQGAVYIKDDFIKQLNSGFHNYGFTINNGLVKLYVDGQLASDEVNIGAVASGQSEMQIGYGGVYGTGRLAGGYARDYIVESIVWSDDDFAKYYNRSKSKVGL